MTTKLSVQERVKILWEAWRQMGRCPDPHMYQVVSSPWIEALGKMADGLTHFIIDGHDSFVEVVAKTWRVESDGPERNQ
jgi:hypothetical protein